MNIDDIINKYSDENPERNEKALQGLKEERLKGELLALEVLEKHQYLSLRKIWGANILGAFWTILISGISFTVLVGLGYLDYFFYRSFPSIVLGTFFLEIIGLAFVVAKFLFPKYR